MMIAFISSFLCVAALATDTTSVPPDTVTMSSTPRLTVRPHEMATGKQTRKAGVTELEGLAGYYVYVPKQCVGTQRAPLVVLLHGGGRSADMEVPKFRQLADKYGMIILAGNAIQPGRWDVLAGFESGQTQLEFGDADVKVLQFPERDVRRIDAALQKVLRTHAIDPDRIALLGFSDGGSYSLFLGSSNLDVFSRIAGLSALAPFSATGPKNSKTQFFLSGGVDEDNMVKQTLTLAQRLRREGHPVVTQLGLRGHVDYVEDEDFIWGWLKESWADPSMTARISKTAATPPTKDPVLTVDAMRRMTKFWTRFQQEPDSIRVTARMARQQQMQLDLGSERASVVAMDLRAMAKEYPSVAADLQAAELTVEQAIAYRRAILCVGFARMAGMVLEGTTNPTSQNNQPAKFSSIDPGSVLGKNLAFRQAYDEEFKALASTGMWVTQ